MSDGFRLNPVTARETQFLDPLERLSRGHLSVCLLDWELGVFKAGVNSPRAERPCLRRESPDNTESRKLCLELDLPMDILVGHTSQ